MFTNDQKNLQNIYENLNNFFDDMETKSHVVVNLDKKQKISFDKNLNFADIIPPEWENDRLKFFGISKASPDIGQYDQYEEIGY
jgi:hypothetical protein